MRAYVFNAALLCEACALETIAALERTTGKPPLESREDSDVWPQGPYPAGGGEADSPQHCDSCGVFLENPLTDDGRLYVLDALVEHEDSGRGDSAVLDEWRKFYGVTDADIWEASQ